MWENARIPQSATSVFFSGNITALGGFSSCHTLTEFIVPDTVTKIWKVGLADLSSCTSITIPDSVTFMGDDALFRNTKLTNLRLSNSLTSLSDELVAY